LSTNLVGIDWIASIDESLDSVGELKFTALQSIMKRFRGVEKIRILVDCDSNLRAKMNAPLLEEAVINLIDNAVKYSERGSEVRIECRQEDKEIVVRVIDNGCGIPEEVLSRVCEPFFTTRPTGQGTGLGLSVSQTIVRQHQGVLDLISEPGKGTSVRIILPC